MKQIATIFGLICAACLCCFAQMLPPGFWKPAPKQTAANAIQNPSFTPGTLSPWTIWPGSDGVTVTGPGYSGPYCAEIYCNPGSMSGASGILETNIRVPAGSPTLTFWAQLKSGEQPQPGYFSGTYRIALSTNGSTIFNGVTSVLNSSWTQYSFAMTAFAGQTITLEVLGDDYNGSSYCDVQVTDFKLQ